MTDAGATGTRRQREGWAELVARFRKVAATARAKRKRLRNPCVIWAEQAEARARDECLWNYEEDESLR